MNANNLSQRSELEQPSANLLAVRAVLKRAGLSLAAHHRRMLNKHWPRPSAIAARQKRRGRADVR
jgi:hypothetical protein